MSTFADQARDKALEIESLMWRLKDDVTQSKARVIDPEARDCLTRLQAGLLIIATDCCQLKSSLMTARSLGEFRRTEPKPELAVTQVYPDRRCAAANDDSLTRY